MAFMLTIDVKIKCPERRKPGSNSILVAKCDFWRVMDFDAKFGNLLKYYIQGKTTATPTAIPRVSPRAAPRAAPG